MLLRAQRFCLHLPVEYRPIGDATWREGLTENISRSGMLFSAEEPILPQVECEFRLHLLVTRPAEILCRGRIVRCSGVRLAATIDRYRFRESRLSAIDALSA